MSNYELYNENYGLWLLIVALRFVFTITAYFPLPLFFAKLRKKEITKRKYTFICFVLNIIPFAFVIAINGGSNGYPYYIWTFVATMIGQKKLEEKQLIISVQQKKEKKNKDRKNASNHPNPVIIEKVNNESSQDNFVDPDMIPSSNVNSEPTSSEITSKPIENIPTPEPMIVHYRENAHSKNQNNPETKPKHSKLLIFLTVLFGIYSIVVSVLYFNTRNHISELSNLLDLKETEISNLNLEITGINKTLSSYKDINSKCSSQNSTYKSALNKISTQNSFSNFYSSKSFLANPKNETIYITLESSYSFTITSTPSTSSIKYEWGEWVDGDTCRLIVYSAPKGMSSITISNDLNNQKVIIYIFVTD